MSRITTSSITPGRIRKFPHGTSNTQPTFIDDEDDGETIENEFDENYPIIRDVSFYSQQQRRSSVQYPSNNKTTGTYYTPQLKRKRAQDQVTCVTHDSFKEYMDTMQSMLKEMHRKIDVINQKEELFEKKLDHMDRYINGLVRKAHKKYNNTNLLSGTFDPTPSGLMKHLVNKLFTEEEIRNRQHEQINERASKIQEAIAAYFYQDNLDAVDLFWDGQGKIVRENQRRGRLHRHKLRAENETQTNTQTTTDNDNNQ
ncbi:unnamed protein product [Rotaria sordida]|uniref:Uncharacterized protein n=1 Tax=Rotaria sordida TaxID=392033 RepID=A0A815KQ40_9BILA|nr:unnamed protein product [Rotaria sordida]CAF1396025.1 unnamed protein product [Rotaria sordida]CAF3836236.1 unnamed protein product [Rotaria sordida]CAF4126043.1 unnamed protein product [Rotaria sordida]